jgi:IS5 family transposase
LARARRIAPTNSASKSPSLQRSIAGAASSSPREGAAGNPYDGHTLAAVIPEIETQIGTNLTRIVADRGYRGQNALERRDGGTLTSC